MRRRPPLRRRLETLLAREKESQGAALNARAADVCGEGGTTEATPTLPDETPLTEGLGTVIGHYKLLEQIGVGGFGAVYVAGQQQPVRRQVATKIIKLGMDTRQVVARFEAERQALALTRQVALTLKGHVGSVNGVAFSRDGNFLASCGADATVRIWPAETTEQAGVGTKTGRP